MNQFFGFQGGSPKSEEPKQEKKSGFGGMFDSLKKAAERMAGEVKTQNSSNQSAPQMQVTSLELSAPTTLAGYLSNGQIYLNNGFVDKALDMLHQGVREGSADCALQLYNMYAQGNGVKTDYLAAYFWARMADDLGDLQGTYIVGACHRDGIGVPADLKKAYMYFEKAARKGYAEAQKAVNKIEYEEIEKYLQHWKNSEHLTLEQFREKTLASPDKAKYFCNCLTMANSFPEESDAKNWVGLCYRNDYGVKAKFPRIEAMYWFRKSQEKGNMYAYFNMARMYESGNGVLVDYDEAIRLYRIAAQKGHALAQKRAVELEKVQRLVLTDLTSTTINWYSYGNRVMIQHYHLLAVKSGNIGYCNSLGLHYSGGFGCKSDDIEALFYFGKGVLSKQKENEKYGWLYESISRMYALGKGIPVDMTLADYYYKKAQFYGENISSLKEHPTIQSALDAQIENRNKDIFSQACYMKQSNMEEAIKRLEQIGANGDIRGYVELARMYAQGFVVNQNADKMLDYLKKGAECSKMDNGFIEKAKAVLLTYYDLTESYRYEKFTGERAFEAARSAFQNGEKRLGHAYLDIAKKMGADIAPLISEYGPRDAVCSPIPQPKQQVSAQSQQTPAQPVELGEPKTLQDYFSYGQRYLTSGRVDKAIETLHEGVRKGSADCALQLYTMYAKGVYVEVKNAVAYFWARMADHLGSAEGAYYVGVFHRDGIGVPEASVLDAYKYFDKAARHGYKDAKAALEEIERQIVWFNNDSQGRTVDEIVKIANESKDEEERTRCYLYLANLPGGDSTAKNLIGLRFRDGNCVEKNLAIAIYWFRRAVEQDKNKYACFNLACLYECGAGVCMDLEEAKRLYQMAAQQGHETSQKRVDEIEKIQRMSAEELCEKGNDYASVITSAPLGHYYYMLAAAKGNPYAMFRLGSLYRCEIGVKRDYIEALIHYGKTIMTDSKEDAKFAYRMIACMYAIGQGIGQNIEIANQHMKKAVELGDTYVKNYDSILDFLEESKEEEMAFYDTQAKLYQESCYVPVDVTKAFELYKLDLQEGNAESAFCLAAMFAYGFCADIDMNYVLDCMKEAQGQQLIHGTWNMVEELLLSYHNLHQFTRHEELTPDVAEEAAKKAFWDNNPRLAFAYLNAAKAHGADMENMIRYFDPTGEYRQKWEHEFAKELFAENDTDMNWETEMNESDHVEVTHLSAGEERKDTLPDNLDSYFEGMIGMEPVKEQLNKIYRTVKMQIMRDEVLRERGIEPTENEKGYNFILLGNPGTGKTTVARIIAKILYDIKIRETDSFVEVERSGVVSDHVGGTTTRMREILNNVKGGTLFIDEAYALYKEESENDFGQEAIDTLMKDMEDNRDSYSVIMAGYKEPMLNMIRHANSGFSSRFSYTIELPDYSDEALVEIAHMHIEKQKLIASEGVDDAIVKCIHHDKLDQTFGNARYIRELVNRAIENQSQRLNEMESFEKDDLFELRPEDFWQGTMEEDGVEKYLEELNKLTGLASVKKDVEDLIHTITVQKEMEKRGMKFDDSLGTLHMAFKGNPGTGKTTVARIIGKLYASLGILKRGDVFVECTRSDLVDRYMGHTAQKVKKVVESAMGGVLFIDEAYALVQGENDSFGKEAVDQLVAEMENNRKNIVIILAGYTNDIDEFLKNNPGLRSRVPKDLFFEDYNMEELYSIALGMLKGKNLTPTEDAKQELRARLVAECMQADFGNARGVRNIVESIWRKQNVRIANLLKDSGADITDEMLLQVEREDVVR